jgi:hypothetical protein
MIINYLNLKNQIMIIINFKKFYLIILFINHFINYLKHLINIIIIQVYILIIFIYYF